MRHQSKRIIPKNNKKAQNEISPNAKLSYLFEWGVDFENRVVKLTGEVNDDMYCLLDSALTIMEASSKKTVTIKINSIGGETYAAMAIVGRIKESTCHIVTKGYGAIMSAATLILTSGHRRKLSRYAWFMWHEMSFGLDETRLSNHKAYLVQAMKEEKQWASFMAESTKKSKEFWRKHGIGHDAYFTAEELLEYGVIDELF